MKTILAFVPLRTPGSAAARASFTEVPDAGITEERPGANAFVQGSGAGLALRTDGGLTPPVGTGVAELPAELPHDMPFGRTFTVRTPGGHRLGIYGAQPGGLLT
ncbi:hypothetical protein [Deinococcus hopiensis]|uniref:Uncharacterized protein n=1 Tax=Deinococcus hopiensis KR-140 TaxID=695939 RepID=A0A1W1V4Q1_9DEIO|nr:hypothetical protein [Deinococcus hopiensis]SMB88379.1 hypothetical protein SAMN00790413_00021 [Deinococcus hopiensis KR-140]